MEKLCFLQEIYVSVNGSNMNDGSKERPLADIQKASELAVPGTIVHVAPGIYKTPVRIEKGGSEEHRIKYISDTKWAASIQPDNFETPVAVNGDYVTFEGFEVYGQSTHGIIVGGSYTSITGNHVYGMAPFTWQCTNNGGAGIVTYSEGYLVHDVDISGNLVHDIGPQTFCNFIHGIYISTDRNKVINNIVYNTSGWGIHGWHAVRNSVIANNLVFGNRRGGIVLGAGDAPGGVITDNCTVVNNIIINNKGNGVDEMGETGLNKYENNLVYSNKGEAFRLQNGNIDKFTVNADPEFINSKPDGSGDFHLKPDSPCINAGTLLCAPSADMECNVRPMDRNMDIGPYAYHF